MSSDSPFQCPVCSAKQSLAETCRRCKADLRLVMAARRRLHYLQTRLADAISSHDSPSFAAALAELRWLAPAVAATYQPMD